MQQHRPQPVAAGALGALARRCWRLAPAERPSMQQAFEALEAMAPAEARPEQQAPPAEGEGEEAASTQGSTQLIHATQPIHEAPGALGFV